MERAKIYLNGGIVPSKDAAIPINDRGLLYGDGIFESFRTYKGKPFQLDLHIKRLLRSAKALSIRPLPGATQLKRSVLKLLVVNKFKESYVKIIITRGQAKKRGLSLKNAVGKPTLIILVEQQKPYSNKMFSAGWKAIISQVSKPDVPSSRIKSLNYLNHILAKREADKTRADEAIMLDDQGYLAEGTISNIFIVKHGIIYTPPKTAPILPGLTRELVIRLAKHSAFKVVEKNITPKELYTADECFITFSGPGVVPITRIWQKKIGRGQPGYVTTSLMELYKEEVLR
jgi:branched-chain amino acid aminotransferase